jgi:beta-lactamase regulating signal transducer with metallopeptidase domain
MTGADIVYALVVGTLVAAAARALEHVMDDQVRPRLRAFSLPGSRWIWAVALLFTIGLIATAPTRRAVPSPAFDSVAPSSASAAAPAMALDQETLLTWTSEWATAATVRAGSLLDGVFGARLLWMWAVTGGLGAVFLIGVYVRYRWIRAHLPGARVRDHDVLLSSSIGPAVIGFRSPAIVVPHWLLERTDDEQEVVLAHECEHIRARDHQLLLLSVAGLLILAWHPAVWWMLSRLRLAMELDCDRRLLDRGLSARRYGTVLIDLAARCSRTSIASAALADGASHLERRIYAMTMTNTTRPRLAGSFTLLIASALLFTTACALHVPTDATTPDGDKAQAAAIAVSGVSMNDSTVNYSVNGRAVSAAEAKGIAPSSVKAIQITKGEQKSVVAIRTEGAASTEPVHGGRGGGLVVVKREGSPIVSSASVADPMWIVDGVVMSGFDRSMLDKADIVSVEVVKGQAAVNAYGSGAINGVILIKTRK